MHLKISSAKWRPFCLGLNVLKIRTIYQTRDLWKLARSCKQLRLYHVRQTREINQVSYFLSRWISKLPGTFEIHWARADLEGGAPGARLP